jgi:hypothetical protein
MLILGNTGADYAVENKDLHLSAQEKNGSTMGWYRLEKTLWLRRELL